MKVQGSAFWNTSIKLDLKDIFNLLVGKEIKHQGYIIGLYHFPDNGCGCEHCTKMFQKYRK